LNGYQSVINVWKDALEAKKVPMLTNSQVNKIIWQSANDKVTVTTADGKTYEADHVIVTVSLGNFLISILIYVPISVNIVLMYGNCFY
jgi:protoporphyrinogen oxidase